MNVVVYSLPDCMPCKTMKKILESLKKEFPVLEIEIVDVSNQDQLVIDLDIQSVPTIKLPDGSFLRGAVDRATMATLLGESLERMINKAMQQHILDRIEGVKI